MCFGMGKIAGKESGVTLATAAVRATQATENAINISSILLPGLVRSGYADAMSRIRMGVIGAGKIAAAFVKESRACELVEVVAIGSRSQYKADEFAAKFNLEKSYGSYQQLVGDPEIDIVYIATPNGEHKEWTVKAAKARKHILCEKPMALTVADVREMFEVAAAHGVVLIEAFPFRFQPQTIEVLNRIHSGDIGEVVTFTGCFGFPLTDMDNVRWELRQGGGSIWDVGVYPINLARAVFGKPPSRVYASGKMHSSGVDSTATVLLKYDDGRTASVWSSFETPVNRHARVAGSLGQIAYGHSNHHLEQSTAVYVIRIDDEEAAKVETGFANGFVLEADAMARLILGHTDGFHGTTEQETIENTATCVAAIESLKTGRAVSVAL
jgi:predicted dehydrogenase